MYDRDLTTDDFMGSAIVTLSDLEIDKWVSQWEQSQTLSQSAVFDVLEVLKRALKTWSSNWLWMFVFHSFNSLFIY